MNIQEWDSWFEKTLKTYDSKEILDKIKISGILSGTIEQKKIDFSNFKRIWKGFSRFGVFLPSLVEYELLQDIPMLGSVITTSNVYMYEKYVSMNMEPHNYAEPEDGYDLEFWKNLLDNLDKRTKPTAGIAIIERFRDPLIRHAVVWIAWKDKKYNIAFYDPIKYEKPTKGTYYRYAEETFQENIDYFLEDDSRYEQVELIDLSDYCYHKTKEEYHCPQYIMNADYCFIYCVLFLYYWVHDGCSTVRKGLGNAVRKAYIVPMKKLTRDDSKESLYFRTIFITFLMQVLRIYFTLLTNQQKSKIESMEQIEDYMKDFSEEWEKVIGLKI